MLIELSPVVLQVGPYAVRWSGLLALLGLAIGVCLGLADARRRGIPRRLVLDVLAWSLPFGIICARMVHVLSWWDFYMLHADELWQLNLDGLSLWGGLLGGAAMAAARLRRSRLRRQALFDAAIPGLGLAISIGRLGEFLDGHGQGLPTSVPWATVYTSPLAATPDIGVPRHPAQLYDGLLALALAGLAWRLPRSVRLPLFLVGYGLGRIVLGAVRLDPAFLFGVQLEQMLAAVAVAFGVWTGVQLVWRRARQPAPAAPRADSLAA